MLRPIALALLLLVAACAEDDPAPSAQRIRLFDLMDRATLVGPPTPDDAPAGETVAVADFDGEVPERLWLLVDEPVSFSADDERLGSGAGAQGAGLSVGPFDAEGAGAAVFLVPAQGYARYDITGRVRRGGVANGDADATHEALRVLEHVGEVDDPSSVPPYLRLIATTHGSSSQRDPAGWDRVSVSFVTRADTGTLELQLRHQDDGSGRSITRFDDVTVRHTPLAEADFWDHLRGLHAPRDGQQESTPWRVRASLPRPGVRAQEVRDAVLLPPPTTLAFPVTHAAPRDTAPRAALSATACRARRTSADGDGAQAWSCGSSPTEGDAIELGDSRGRPQERPRRSAAGSTPSNSTSLPARRPGPDVLVVRERSTSPAARRHRPPRRRGARRHPASSPRRIETAPGAFNVLLIGVDTLRADRMGVFGYERPHDAAARRASPDQGDALQRTRGRPRRGRCRRSTSVLTSLYPSAHGAGRGGHDEWTPDRPRTPPRSPKCWRDVGYHTQGHRRQRPHPRRRLRRSTRASRATSFGVEHASPSTADSESVANFVPRRTPHDAVADVLAHHGSAPAVHARSRQAYRDAFTDADYEGRFAGGRRSTCRSTRSRCVSRPPARTRTRGRPPLPSCQRGRRGATSATYYDAEIAEVDAGDRPRH